MTRRDFVEAAGLAALATVSPLGAATAQPAAKPNIIFILADDLGYGELGCFGQKLIRTPCLDRMAAEGMRFTQFYAGSTVCAPSRCVLMTGLHTGHTRVRGNGGPNRQALKPGDVTVAAKLKQAGYATALIGKWGLGDDVEGGREGHPLAQGFDYFFGYLNQGHAHNYYPEWLWKDRERVPLRNKVQRVNPDDTLRGTATERVDYSHDLFAADALRWVHEQAGKPFFLYLALTIPHANNEGKHMTGDGAEVPDYGEYDGENWGRQDKGQAAMISRMDRDVGRLLDLLRELDLARNTLVLFSSDNGPHNEAGHNPARFQPSGPLRGMKRDLYEGGIRVPAIAWWPGRVPAGAVSDHVAWFADFMPSASELAGALPPTTTDGISFVPELLGRHGDQPAHQYLYWEFHERKGARALRLGNWKATRAPWHAPIQLFDLATDLGEQHDVAAQHPDIVRRLEQIMEKEHAHSDAWPEPKP